jgi:indolepyruvate ferredoxin oxidoreductase alpha subunit
MVGMLSTVAPFDVFPPELWLRALQKANAKPAVWAANYAAFQAGRACAAQVGPFVTGA